MNRSPDPAFSSAARPLTRRSAVRMAAARGSGFGATLASASADGSLVVTTAVARSARLSTPPTVAVRRAVRFTGTRPHWMGAVMPPPAAGAAVRAGRWRRKRRPGPAGQAGERPVSSPPMRLTPPRDGCDIPAGHNLAAMELELRHLRVVCRLADTGSVSKAAAALGVSQPSLTAQLHRIEEAVGGSLFERGSTGVVPTPLGKHVRSEEHTSELQS